MLNSSIWRAVLSLFYPPVIIGGKNGKNSENPVGSNKSEKRKPKSAVYRSFWASVVYFHLRLISIKSHKREMTRNQFEGNLTGVRIPPAAPKIRPSAKGRWPYFWASLSGVAPPQGDRICSGQVNCPCAKALLRKILVTAHPRRPTLWGPGSVGIHTDMP